MFHLMMPQLPNFGKLYNTNWELWVLNNVLMKTSVLVLFTLTYYLCGAIFIYEALRVVKYHDEILVWNTSFGYETSC